MHGIAAYTADGRAFLTSETFNPVYVKDATLTSTSPRIGAINDLTKPVMECYYTVTGIKKPMPFVVANVGWVAIFAIEKTGSDTWKIVVITSGAAAPRVLVFDQYDPATPSSGDTYGMQVFAGSGEKVFDSASTRKPLNLKAVIDSPPLEWYVWFDTASGQYQTGSGKGNFWRYTATGEMTIPLAHTPAIPAVNFLSTGEAWWGAWYSANSRQYQAFSAEIVKCTDAGASFSVGLYNETNIPGSSAPVINSALHSRSKPVLVIDASRY